MENNMEVSQKKIDLPYNLAILLLSIYPKEMEMEMETGYWKDVWFPCLLQPYSHSKDMETT